MNASTTRYNLAYMYAKPHIEQIVQKKKKGVAHPTCIRNQHLIPVIINRLETLGNQVHQQPDRPENANHTADDRHNHAST